MNICSICYEEMNMKEYNDEKESTETCFKLDCGHSFHTKCIFMVLKKSNHECPTCNKYKTPESKLELEGRCRKILYTVLKEPEIKEIKNEFNEAKKSYKECIKSIKKEVGNFVNKMVKEYKFFENREYYQICKQKAISEIKKACTEKGNKHLGAFFSRGNNRYGPAFGERILSGNYRSVYNYRYLTSEYWHLKNPRIYISLSNITKNKDD